MLKNILKVSWRNLKKYKLYSLVNILGLSLSLLAVFCIALYVQDELSFDQDHPFAERTYRVDVDCLVNEQVINSAQTAALMGATMKEDFPQVEAFCRFRGAGNYLVKYEEQHFREDRVVFTDSSLFDVFALDLVAGDPRTALAQPSTAVLSPVLAEKYFGDEDPMGKTIILDNEDPFMITGVLESMPTNFHFEFDLFLSLSSRGESEDGEWGSMNFNTYVVLQEGVEAEDFEPVMSEHITLNYFAPYVEPYIGTSWDEFMAAGNVWNYRFFPLTDIHLHSDKEDELGINNDVQYVWGFALIGFFILFLACINYTNLSTARSAIRSREIGVRKVVGADRSHLVRQFLGESLLLSFLALFIALSGLFLLMSQFNELSGKTFSYEQVLSPGFLLLALLVTSFTGLMAGSYPAMVLSQAKPLVAIRGVLQKSGSKPYFRNGLVVFQFFTAIVIVISTLAVYQQLQYIHQKKLGFDRNQVLVLNEAYALDNQLSAFKEQALALPEVQSATVSGYLPTPSYESSSSYFMGRSPENADVALLNNWVVDHDYLTTLGMELKSGRDFSRDFGSDSTAVILNEQAAKLFTGNPIGQVISTYGENEELIVYEVIGVVQDFHYESLRNTIEPLAFFLGESTGFISLRLGTENLNPLIQKLDILWNSLAPGTPFSYAFLDERFDEMYQNEMQLSSIMLIFAGMAVIVACIGMIGLTTFLTQQRTKEIGIRKVLGASSPSIIQLLSREFVGLVFVATLIGIPVAWYLTRKWLQNFAYPAEISWSLFAGAGLLSVLLAFLLITILTWQAALANPVNSLRSE